MTDLSDIYNLLNEEKWTRFLISNYTINNFTVLDEKIENIFENGEEEKLITMCKEHINASQNTILALYIMGIINLRQFSTNESFINRLLEMFYEQQRWNIVQFLAQRVLQFRDHKYALRLLALYYQHENQLEDMYITWERLIRIDFEEADIVLKLAERAQNNNDDIQAISLYKKSLYRYINKKRFSQVRDIWLILLHMIPEEIDFFNHSISRMGKVFEAERCIELLQQLLDYYQEQQKWDTAIAIIKRIVDLDPKYQMARKSIIYIFEQKYAHHSRLKECLKNSNIQQSWRNLYDAIADFEKHIAFDKGNYVFHRSWGVGFIKDIIKEELTIDFVKKKGHTMSLKMAVNALQFLGKRHIWVYKITRSKAELNEKVKKDPAWALVTIIKSFDNMASMKKIKSELVPSILTDGEWTSWNIKARKMLKTDKRFSSIPDNVDAYMVRSKPITIGEKFLNRFLGQKEFFGRVTILQEFLQYILETGDDLLLESDYFLEMYDYFAGYYRNLQQLINVNNFASLLVIQSMQEAIEIVQAPVSLNIEQLFQDINHEQYFKSIANAELKKTYLLYIKKYMKEWHDIYFSVFPYYLQKNLMYELMRNGYEDKIIQLFYHSYQNYREYRNIFVWFVKNCHDDEWFTQIPVNYGKIIIALLRLLEVVNRDIVGKKDIQSNKKIDTQIIGILIKEGRFIDYLHNPESASVAESIALLLEENSQHISIKNLRILQNAVHDIYPNLAVYSKVHEHEITVRNKFYATMESYEIIQKRLKHILEVEVPANSKEIDDAREFGDLKENAEYKAAKERQEMLNAQTAKIKEEIEQVAILKRDDITDTTISFGTFITLKNIITDQKEEYHIMGPWESDPDKCILSHLAPFSLQLIGKKAQETVQFIINERDYNYHVESITISSLIK